MFSHFCFSNFRTFYFFKFYFSFFDFSQKLTLTLFTHFRSLCHHLTLKFDCPAGWLQSVLPPHFGVFWRAISGWELLNFGHSRHLFGGNSEFQEDAVLRNFLWVGVHKKNSLNAVFTFSFFKNKNSHFTPTTSSECLIFWREIFVSFHSTLRPFLENSRGGIYPIYSSTLCCQTRPTLQQ